MTLIAFIRSTFSVLQDLALCFKTCWYFHEYSPSPSHQVIGFLNVKIKFILPSVSTHHFWQGIYHIVRIQPGRFCLNNNNNNNKRRLCKVIRKQKSRNKQEEISCGRQQRLASKSFERLTNTQIQEQERNNYCEVESYYLHNYANQFENLDEINNF